MEDLNTLSHEELEFHLLRLKSQIEESHTKLHRISELIEKLKVREAALQDEIRRQRLIEGNNKELVVTVFRFPSTKGKFQEYEQS